MGLDTIDFKQLQQQPSISEMLSALEKGLNKYGIDFYLLGTIEQNLEMQVSSNFPSIRTAQYIDFSIFIDDKNAYADLREYLIDVEGFIPYKDNLFALKWENVAQIGLVPFGEFQTKPSKVTLGLTSMDMLVFNAIYNPGLKDTESTAKNNFNLCSLPGIVLLKLIAFQEYPETRADIIKDISKIIKHFFDIYTHEIYEKHNDLFGNHDINLQWIAGRIIGREMRKKTELNENLFLKIKKLLQKNTSNPSSSDLAKFMSSFSESTIEDNLKIIKQMKIGYLEN